MSNENADQKRLAVIGSKFEPLVTELYQDMLDGKNKQIESLKVQLQETTNINNDTNVANEDLKNRLNDLNGRINELESENNSLKIDLDKAKSENASH